MRKTKAKTTYGKPTKKELREASYELAQLLYDIYSDIDVGDTINSGQNNAEKIKSK